MPTINKSTTDPIAKMKMIWMTGSEKLIPVTQNEIEQDWRTEHRPEFLRRIKAKLFPQPAFLPDAFPSPDSYQERLRRRDALFDWCLEHDPEFTVTLQFGESVDDNHVAVRVEKFVALLDRYWLGAKWARQMTSERTWKVGVIEEGPKRGHTHVHLLIRRPCRLPRLSDWREREQGRFLSLHFTQLGRRKGICPRGNVRFDRLREADDQVLAVSYALKDFHVGRDLLP